ncbi:DUF1566 domain-containing protein [Methylobacter sp. S3L5C]|uniref:Lcl domain-containing protein n=1 Tax=Methylobacter sp. S3L5C TaxID=2839024 RepID=UPI001FAC9FAE|nr:DUF1566 domain-containing protein [Methylobacter sp. S3L5C]UOA09829.1 DUF1566 domain-containing protein [Methylobacter sp. S3L5C]
MQHKKTRLALALIIGVVATTGTAHASLFARGTDLVYDDVNNITWVADANLAKTSGYDRNGKMEWSTAVAWANGLDYAGYTDWVLPTINQFTNQLGPVLSKIGRGNGDKDHSGDKDDSKYDLFTNVKNDKYWSSEDAGKDKTRAFDIKGGKQSDEKYNKDLYAWAVRSGDVATVPLPGAVWLFLTGMIGVMGLNRRKNTA